MTAWLFWSIATVFGLIGIAMLVAGWELVRRDPEVASTPVPLRVHSIDLNLGEAAGVSTAAPDDTGSPPTDSDARRRALAQAMVRMSEPAAPAARPVAAKAAWEDTQPRVNLPAVERTPPA